VNLVRPDQSTLVLKVGSGHNYCWVADPSACAATMLVWIQAWIGAGSASTTSVQADRTPGAGGPVGGKQVPRRSHRGQPELPVDGLSAADQVLLGLSHLELGHRTAARTSPAPTSTRLTPRRSRR